MMRGFIRDVMWGLKWTAIWIFQMWVWVMKRGHLGVRKKKCVRCGREFLGEYCRYCWEWMRLKELERVWRRNLWKEVIRKKYGG
jgi:hypothetical protein